MKPLAAPRAVLYFPHDPEGLTSAGAALARLGIEGYPADRWAALPERALRQDTLLIVAEVGVAEAPEALAALRAIRANEGSRGVLVALVAHEALAPSFLDEGAGVVQPAPLTPAGACTMLLRLARRGQEAPKGSPAAVLSGRVEQALARFKIYLGAAPGVGKTFAMLGEAHARLARGEDVLVGLVEAHGRQETLERLEGLPVLPRRTIAYKGAELREMDLDGLLARRPGLALVDELAHTNMPGSLNKKRYEDVNVLRLAGIPVVSTLNIQHVESLNNLVERLTGVKVRETVPDWVLQGADEVVLVDLPPEELQARLQAGKIYAPEKIGPSLSGFFTTYNLTALRELVLRELADRVDERLEAVRATLGKPEGAGIQDRLLVCVTPTPEGQRLVRRGARLADRLNGKLLVAHVEARPLAEAERAALEATFELAESLDAEIVKLRHPDPAEALARYALAGQITIMVLGETRLPRWKLIFGKTIFQELLDRTSAIDIVTVGAHA